MNYLIVCSDEERELELARVVAEGGHIYRCLGEVRGSWTFHSFQEGHWVAQGPEHVPSQFDALFFHTGRRDPEKIPDGRSFGRCFAFSTFGVELDAARTLGETLGRKVIAIRRPFPSGSSLCPIKPRHLHELEAFVCGGPDLPSFCSPAEPCSDFLVAAYLVALAARDGTVEQKEVCELLSSSDWTAAQEEFSSRVSGVSEVRPGIDADRASYLRRANWPIEIFVNGKPVEGLVELLGLSLVADDDVNVR